MLMRAVNIHQHLPEFGENIQGCRGAIDELSICPSTGYRSLKHEFITLAFQTTFLEKWSQCGFKLSNIKNSFNRTAIAPVTNEGAIGPFPQHKVQSANDY